MGKTYQGGRHAMMKTKQLTQQALKSNLAKDKYQAFMITRMRIHEGMSLK